MTCFFRLAQRLIGSVGIGTGASQGLILTSDLFLTFPVSGVNLLGNSAKTIKGMQFTDATDLILDLVRETRVEVMTQGAIAISLNLGRDSVEVNHIAIDTMVTFMQR